MYEMYTSQGRQAKCEMKTDGKSLMTQHMKLPRCKGVLHLVPLGTNATVARVTQYTSLDSLPAS